MPRVAYLDVIATPSLFKKKLTQATKVLKPHLDKFEAIATIGCSGYFGAALSLRVNKPLIMIRKESERGHKSELVVSRNEYKNYLFVDNLIDSGTTFKAVNEKLKNIHLYGILLYNQKFLWWGSNTYLNIVNNKDIILLEV